MRDVIQKTYRFRLRIILAGIVYHPIGADQYSGLEGFIVNTDLIKSGLTDRYMGCLTFYQNQGLQIVIIDENICSLRSFVIGSSALYSDPRSRVTQVLCKVVYKVLTDPLLGCEDDEVLSYGVKNR